MPTGLSKIYSLDINCDFKGLAGLDYFPNLLYSGSPTFAHPHCHSLLSGFAVAGAGELLTHHPLCPSLHPQESCPAELTNCTICSPSHLFLLCQVPHWHHPSPTPALHEHKNVHYYANYF